MAYRINVVTDSVPEAVLYAGGLMFDRRRAGWDVIVTTHDHRYSTALTILGVRVLAPAQAVERDVPSRGGALTVVSRAGAHEGSAHPETLFQDRSLMWGPQGDTPAPSLLQPVRHELSAAARAFKEQALRCVDSLSGTERFEVFWTTDIAGADLAPHDAPRSFVRHRGGTRSPTAVGR